MQSLVGLQPHLVALAWPRVTARATPLARMSKSTSRLMPGNRNSTLFRDNLYLEPTHTGYADIAGAYSPRLVRRLSSLSPLIIRRISCICGARVWASIGTGAD